MITTSVFVVDRLAVVDTIDAPDHVVLTLALAAPRHRRIAGPFGSFAGAIDIVDGGNNHAEGADIHSVLDVPFLRVRQANHRRGGDARTGRDHGLDVFVFERAVLHLEPGVVVVPGFFAVARGVGGGLREAEDLFSREQFRLDCVVERRGFGGGRRGLLSLRDHAKQGCGGQRKPAREQLNQIRRPKACATS
jgi:hypothetical protein